MFLARLNGEGGKIFVEINDKDVALNLARIDDGENLPLEYWKIIDGVSVTLQKATLKTGARATGEVKEIVEVEAGGSVVASAERVAP